MSSTTTRAPSKPAPWKQEFLNHMDKMESPEFVLATVANAPKGSPVPFVPRARFCIFRGFWTELPENKHNTAPKNERIFESELFTFTTDVRMHKVGELFATSAGHADREELVQGSGGGGPVEATWWVKDAGMQWRVRGSAFVVANDIEENEDSSGVRTVKSEIGSRMRAVQEGKEGDWSWKKEVDGHFGNLSPGMRGSFKAPPPGHDVKESFDDNKYQLGSKVDTLDDPAARENFRVVIIKPEWVEVTDVGGTDECRRRQYEYESSSGDWKVTETWP